MSDDVETGPLPEFFVLLREAANAAEAVDTYDLESDTPGSAEEFSKLQADEAEAAEALIRHAQVHGEAVIAALKLLAQE